MRLDVHVATPQPKKSVSSVQMGQPTARAAGRIGQILAPRTSALPVIALLVTGRATNTLAFLHQLVFASAPGGDHFVQILCDGAHCFKLGFPVPVVGRDKEAKGFAMPHDGERVAGLQVASEVLTEFANADFEGFHIVYSLYAIWTEGLDLSVSEAFKHGAAALVYVLG